MKHLVACLGRHGASANFLTLSFTTTTRNLSACDVIMKMVYCAADDKGHRDVTGRSSLEVKMAVKQSHRQKSFSGDHSKNLKQSNEKSPDT